jgi:teichuronic acid biosynthesis glycosyltransferase TuaC
MNEAIVANSGMEALPSKATRLSVGPQIRVLAVTNIYPTSAHPALGTYVEQQVRSLRDIGVVVDVWYLDRAAQGRGVYMRLGKKLREKLEAEKYDVVHIMYSGLLAELATRSVHNIPTVVTIHGSDLLGSELSRPAQRFSAYLGVLASRRAAHRADGIIAVSNGLRTALPQYIDRSKVRVIPCGIDLDRFKPMDPIKCRQELGWDSSAVHILFATARGDPIKRPELAAKAVAALKQLGLNAQMHEMQGIPYDRVPIWINASDALILTSQHEGSPTIVKECLGCNVPVVSVDVGDVRDQIEGVEGCVIAAADSDELAAGLRAASLARAHVNGRERIERFSLENSAERVRDFYRDILCANGADRMP